MDKLVTIIMPVYNAEQFLKDSIIDIRNQTYRFWELICVDDGSTDQSGKILTEFQREEERIKVLRQTNKGAACARNSAMKYISGEYVLCLDADDRFHPEVLEKAVMQAECLQTDILLFDAECFDHETGQKLPGEWLVMRDKLPAQKVFCFQDFPENIFLFSHSVPWNKLYRTKFLRENEIIFQEIPFEEDVVFVSMANIKAEKLSFLDEPLVKYRQNNHASLTGKIVRQKYPMCVYDAMEALRQALVEEGIYEQVWKGFVNYAAEHFLWNLEVMAGDGYECLYAKTKEYFRDIVQVGRMEAADFIRDDLHQKIKRLCQYDQREYLFFLLQDKRQVIEKINKDFAGLLEYTEKLKKNLEFIKSNRKWIFESKKVPAGSRIILYGAGEVGRDYFAQFKREGCYHLVAWVDRNYKEMTGGFHIEAPEKIPEYEWDYVIIAACNPEIVRDIHGKLNSMGISDSRIEQMFL